MAGNNIRRAFEDALIIDRVASRYRFAMEFDTPEALAKYLKDHPQADRSQHSVKKGPSGEKPEQDSGAAGKKPGPDKKPKSSEPKLKEVKKVKGLLEELKREIVRSDMRNSKSRGYNPNAMGLILQQAHKIEDALKEHHDSDSDEAIGALRKQLTRGFTKDFAPAKKILKHLDSLKSK